MSSRKCDSASVILSVIVLHRVLHGVLHREKKNRQVPLMTLLFLNLHFECNDCSARVKLTESAVLVRCRRIYGQVCTSVFDLYLLIWHNTDFRSDAMGFLIEYAKKA